MLVTIAVLGGTGKEGSGLALRWANSGYRVFIGSRAPERAQAKAEELNAQLGGTYIAGMSNLEAAKNADVVVLSVPYEAHRAILEEVREALGGKVMIDVTVPIIPPHVRQVFVPDGHSASLEAQEFLGEDTKVVAAFQNVSAVHLKDIEHPVDCDVLVCGNDMDAKADAIHLVKAAGMRGIDAGPLANSVAVEALTPVLLYINREYQVKGAGIRITGLPVDG
ncbi:MAG: NADPH-dependent F420 reductase [Chloroflexi bacterium]|nr:NADPH-dependent F420 reductase [Chloroflexota bacterium]